jgi:hypothetical protein
MSSLICLPRLSVCLLALHAIRNALFPLAKSKVRLDPMPWTTFADAEVAHVG